MKETQKNNDNSFHSRNESKNNKNDNSEKDNDDILRQLSQITPSEDKSFDSPMITKNLPKFFDYKINTNDLSQKNSNPFTSIQESIKQNTYENDNSIINNNYLLLNGKLEYLISIIQASNINIKKYDDLKEFNRYLCDNNLILNYHEPINILFDTISQLIFFIQRELKNNDILMSEIKRLKKDKKDNEKLMYNLKYSVIEKEKELKEIKRKENEERYQKHINELNSLRNENKELFTKSNIYKIKIKKSVSNNKINPINSFNENNNDSKKMHSLYNLIKLNNSYDDTSCKTAKNKNTNFKFYNNNNNSKSHYNYISPQKELSSINPNNEVKRPNEKSLISNMKLLLKQINNMLNIYNSSLDKINLNNKTNIENTSDIKENSVNKDDNIKNITMFLDKMDEKIKTMETYLKDFNKNEILNNKRMIHVNTSRWKFTKKTHNKNNDNKNNDIKNISQNENNDSLVKINKSKIFQQKLNSISNENIYFGYKAKTAFINKENS